MEREQFEFVPITQEELTDITKDVEFAREEINTRLLHPMQIEDKNIVANRREFLKSEIAKLQRRISHKEQDIQDLDLKRSELMKTLRTHGALEEYIQLQTIHQDTVVSLKEISQRLENLKKFEEGKSSIILEQEILRQQDTADLNERRIQKELAILTFNAFSEKLYEASGALSINISNKGYKFDIKIQKSSSHGIGNMKIFCYDLTLVKIWNQKTTSTNFLIHDSIIFDGVDERQNAIALQLAESESRKEEFQYICTMNSDTVPRNEFDKNFDFNKHIVKTLTDATSDGGLLGIRF